MAVASTNARPSVASRFLGVIADITSRPSGAIGLALDVPRLMCEFFSLSLTNRKWPRGQIHVAIVL